MTHRLLRGIVSFGVLVIGLTIGLAATVVIMFRGSLPALDGAVISAATPAEITLERDAGGVVTVRGPSAAATAYGLGYAHGQDRFFQMDLARRLAAGELAALFGAGALGQDRLARPFGFRAVARRALTIARPEERTWLAAYVAGVNAGLGSLRARPWEYWLLRARPSPWREEDSLLVLHAMWWQLQFDGIARERSRREVEARVTSIVADASAGEADSGRARTVLQFLFPHGTEWDTPNFAASGDATAATGGSGDFDSPAIPPPELLDLRAPTLRSPRPSPPDPPLSSRPPGSNNWAVAGAHTASGAALVANDMHLMLRVPTVWYRARLQIGGLDLNGVTLPGVPGMVVGSNGRIAWGLTNSYGDWSDVAQVSCDLTAGTYLTDAGWRRFDRRVETLEIARADAQPFVVWRSPLGVLLGASADGRSCTLVRWLALEDGATNLRMLEFQNAGDVAEAMALAPQVGVPQLNLVVGDRAGRIGWTVIGRIPRGFDGPSTAAPIEWRDADEQPQLLDPALGRLWTANARVVDGEAERVLGSDEASGGLDYELGARARQIRDGLLALEGRAVPADMLRIQLDDRALFMERWRRLLLATLDEDALKNAPRRAELRRWAEGWNGRAAVTSVGYRIVREFRLRTQQATWQMLLDGIGTGSGLDAPPPPQFEGPLWRLVTEQPEHLLASVHADWRQFLLAQVDATAAGLRAACGNLERCTWGAQNRVALRHPLSAALPWLSRLIDMPVRQLPGDQDMPRVQSGEFGASERFAVEPGREAEGYLHLPGGQSGHPLSPFYRSGFDDWARGTPTPLLPGATLHTLRLSPQRAAP